MFGVTPKATPKALWQLLQNLECSRVWEEAGFGELCLLEGTQPTRHNNLSAIGSRNELEKKIKDSIQHTS